MKYTNASTKNLDVKLRELLAKTWIRERSTFAKGLFIVGTTGVGKTYTLHAVRNKLIDDPNVMTSNVGDVENWIELLFELRDRISSGGVRPFVEHLLSKSFVFIDDIGAEKQTEWSQEMLYLIINKLYESNKPLFITTNLTLDEFTSKYGDRLVSRIAEMCEVYEVEGVNRRFN
jgi:DNA replication protein DnaC